MSNYPGLKLASPKLKLAEIISLAENAGIGVAEIPVFETYGWKDRKSWGIIKRIKFRISRPPQEKVGEWRVVGPGEIGIIFRTSLDDLERWPDERKTALEVFIRKLQAGCRELYFFDDFNGHHWSYLNKQGDMLPWKPVPKKDVLKFLLENR